MSLSVILCSDPNIYRDIAKNKQYQEGLKVSKTYAINQTSRISHLYQTICVTFHITRFNIKILTSHKKVTFTQVETLSNLTIK